jgi:predicted glycoside hydrolase/deacetylase ChbG (UPF0249 family)
MMKKAFCWVLIASVSVGCLGLCSGLAAEENRDIRLIVRADDIGSAHAANVACIRSFREGIARSVEVMVPCPWFNEAAEMLRDCPDYDVGVHLTLTSEWANYKWGPLTQSPSLVDENGHFPPTNRAFADASLDIKEVEKELRAQIELAKRLIPQVSHLSSLMGTPTSTPELRALVQGLAEEYKLPVETPGAKGFRWGVGNSVTPEERESALINALEKLEPGIWILVEHPGLDTDEMRAMGHEGYWNVAAHRDAVTKAFTSQKVKAVIDRLGIQLVSYGEVWGEK